MPVCQSVVAFLPARRAPSASLCQSANTLIYTTTLKKSTVWNDRKTTPVISGLPVCQLKKEETDVIHPTTTIQEEATSNTQFNCTKKETDVGQALHPSLTYTKRTLHPDSSRKKPKFHHLYEKLNNTQQLNNGILNYNIGVIHPVPSAVYIPF